MKGAIIGDVVGSVYEAANVRTKRFPLLSPGSRFTDDTVCTVAVAECLLDDDGRGNGDPAASLRRWGARYPRAGYGGMFRRWLADPATPAYGSWGNGGAMRVSPCGHVARTLDEALALADRVTAVTHDHPDAMQGARAVAGAVRLAREGATAPEIARWVRSAQDFRLDVRLDEVRETDRFDVSAAGTVPVALVAALEARDLEDAIRNAVSVGGDSDTIAAIAGSLAEPLYGVPDDLWAAVAARLPPDMLGVVDRFYSALRPPPVAARIVRARRNQRGCRRV